MRAQEERILYTCNVILISPFTLQRLCNTRVTVENIHEITSDVVIMIIAVLLCLWPRESGRVFKYYHCCGALSAMSVSIAVTCLRGGQCHPASYTAPRTHSITGGRQRGLYQNIDRDTHCLLHQELMRIQLILINVSLFNSFSLCTCTDVGWSFQSLSS